MFGNLHPLFLMNQKEVRKATRLFEMLDEHLAKPLMKINRGADITQVNKVYDSNVYETFLTTSNQLSNKLQEIALAVLERGTGLKAGMVIKIARDNTNVVAIIKIETLRLGHITPLSSSPHQWEWRVYGKLFSVIGNNVRSIQTEYPLSGNVSIERQVLNGVWLPMVSHNIHKLDNKTAARN